MVGKTYVAESNMTPGLKVGGTRERPGRHFQGATMRRKYLIRFEKP